MKALGLICIAVLSVTIGCGTDTVLTTDNESDISSVDERTENPRGDGASSQGSQQAGVESEAAGAPDKTSSAEQKPFTDDRSSDEDSNAQNYNVSSDASSTMSTDEGVSNETATSSNESGADTIDESSAAISSMLVTESSSMAQAAASGRIEAEAYLDAHPQIQKVSGNSAIGYFEVGRWLHYKVNFGEGTNVFQFSIADAIAGGAFEVRLGSVTGAVIGTLYPKVTTDWDTYELQPLSIVETSGIQDVYIVGSEGLTICNINYFELLRVDKPLSPTALSGSATDSTITLTWSDEADNETGYAIYVSKTDSRPMEPHAAIEANSTGYVIEGRRSGTEYNIWVVATVEGFVESDVSHVAVSTSGEVDMSEDFTIVILPDTQFYVVSFSYAGGNSTPDIFYSQTEWVYNNIEGLNIKFVSHVGDIVENGEADWEWGIANTAMSKLDGRVPYGIAPGNHDGTPKFTTNYSLFNQTFSRARYASEEWFGGGYPEGSYTNSYQLFSASGMDFLIFHLETWPSNAILQWADGVVNQHSDKRVIITTHDYGTDSSIWSGFAKKHSNVFMINYGHQCAREDVYTQAGDAGNTVHVSLTDYQCDYAGGNGNLRYYTFKPEENKVYGYTYSPWSQQYETDWNSEFEFEYSM